MAGRARLETLSITGQDRRSRQGNVPERGKGQAKACRSGEEKNSSSLLVDMCAWRVEVGTGYGEGWGETRFRSGK